MEFNDPINLQEKIKSSRFYSYLSTVLIFFCVVSCGPLVLDNDLVFPSRHASLESGDEGRRYIYDLRLPRKSVSLGSTAGVLLSLDNFRSFKAHSSGINDLATFSSGYSLVSAGDDGRLVLSSVVDPQSRAPLSSSYSQLEAVSLEVLVSASKPILSVAVSANERYVAFAGFSYVGIYDLSEGEIVARLSKLKGRITALSWDPRGELLAIGRANGDVFVWRFGEVPTERLNDMRYVEKYIGGSSSVQKIIFHKNARIFFVAERDGDVVLWRLLRTEEEAGLRGSFEAKEESLSSLRIPIGRTPARLSDLWYSAQSDTLFASADDGGIYRFDVRALEALPSGEHPQASLFSIAGVVVDPAIGGDYEQERLRLIASVGRERRIKFYCENDLAIFETPQFVDGPVTLASLEDSSVLWAGGKTGRLIALNAETFPLSRQLQKRMRLCY